jgi:hypothetical protein
VILEGQLRLKTARTGRENENQTERHLLASSTYRLSANRPGDGQLGGQRARAGIVQRALNISRHRDRAASRTGITCGQREVAALAIRSWSAERGGLPGIEVGECC